MDGNAVQTVYVCRAGDGHLIGNIQLTGRQVVHAPGDFFTDLRHDEPAGEFLTVDGESGFVFPDDGIFRQDSGQFQHFITHDNLSFRRVGVGGTEMEPGHAHPAFDCAFRNLQLLGYLFL